MPTSILFPQSVQKDDIHSIGKQAFHLSKLITQGVPVAPFFIITPTFLKEVLLEILKIDAFPAAAPMDSSAFATLKSALRSHPLTNDNGVLLADAFNSISHQHSVQLTFSLTTKNRHLFFEYENLVIQALSFNELKQMLLKTLAQLLDYGKFKESNCSFEEYIESIPSLIMSDYKSCRVSCIADTRSPFPQGEKQAMLYVRFGQHTLNPLVGFAEQYIINTHTEELISYIKLNQKNQMIRKGDQELIVDVARLHRQLPILSQQILSQLIRLTKEIHYLTKRPQKLYFDIIDKSALLTGIHDLQPDINFFKTSHTPVYKTLQGRPTFKGITNGKVKHLKTPADSYRINSHDILVIKELKTWHIPLMKRAGGYIIDKITPDFHLLLKSHTLTKPGIYNCPDVASLLNEGSLVFLNSMTGEIRTTILKKPLHIQPKLISNSTDERKSGHQHFIERTDIKVYTDLSAGERFERDTRNGVSLIKSASLMQTLLENTQELNTSADYEQSLIHYITQTLQCKSSTPLLYQSAYTYTHPHELKNKSDITPPIGELNQILGAQGAHSIIKNPAFFRQECDALHSLVHTYKFSNVIFALPYVRTPSELHAVKELIHASRLTRSHRFRLFLSLHIPVNIFMLEKFLDETVDGVLFDMEKIAQLLLGYDHVQWKKENKQTYFTNPALTKALEFCTEICSKRHIQVFVSVPSDVPHPIVKKLMEYPIQGFVSVPEELNKVQTQTNRVRETVHTRTITF